MLGCPCTRGCRGNDPLWLAAARWHSLLHEPRAGKAPSCALDGRSHFSKSVTELKNFLPLSLPCSTPNAVVVAAVPAQRGPRLPLGALGLGVSVSWVQSLDISASILFLKWGSTPSLKVTLEHRTGCPVLAGAGDAELHPPAAPGDFSSWC